MEKEKPYTNVDYFEDLTGEIPAAQTKSLEEVGARIHALREEKGLSLEELSRLTGFDTGLLAEIEADQVKPQLGTIIRLSKALDSAFGRIVSGWGERLYSVTRRNEQKIVHRSTSRKGKKPIYTYRGLAPEVKGRHMEPLIVQLEETPDEEMSVHEGEEFIYVLDGTAALKIGEEAFELHPGDSVYYLSTTPHLIYSKSGRATILAVMYGG